MMDALFLLLFFGALLSLYYYLRPIKGHLPAVRWTCSIGLLYLGILYVVA